MSPNPANPRAAALRFVDVVDVAPEHLTHSVPVICGDLPLHRAVPRIKEPPIVQSTALTAVNHSPTHLPSFAMAFVAPLSLSLAAPHASRRPRATCLTSRSTFVGTSCLPRPCAARSAQLSVPPARPHMVSTNMHDVTTPVEPSSPPPSSPRNLPLTLAAVTLGLAAGVWVLSRRVSLSAVLSALMARVSELGTVRGALLLSCVNFCTVLFCFPANMGLMIGAGAMLGPLPAFLALFSSKLVAASVAFVLARFVLYRRANRWLQRYPKLNKLLTSTGKEGGWKFVLLMRLSPFPGFLLNYLLSLTGVGFAEYIFGTILGIAPSISNLVLVGATAKDVGVGVSGGTLRGGWLGVALKVVCMLSMVVVSVVITRRARKAFAELDEDGKNRESGDGGKEAVQL